MIGSIGGQTNCMNGCAPNSMNRAYGAARSYQAFSTSPSKAGQKNPKELSEEDQKTVDELKKRDQEVRAHEQAHKTMGGQYVIGGASFEYETGPDGKRYAVGGEVQIDVTPIKDDPEATIRKMQQVRKAALAPAKPSAQDRRVAALASQKMAEASRELNAQKSEDAQTGTGKVGKQKAKAEPATYTPQFSFNTSHLMGQNLNMMA